MVRGAFFEINVKTNQTRHSLKKNCNFTGFTIKTEEYRQKNDKNVFISKELQFLLVLYHASDLDSISWHCMHCLPVYLQRS